MSDEVGGGLMKIDGEGLITFDWKTLYETSKSDRVFWIAANNEDLRIEAYVFVKLKPKEKKKEAVAAKGSSSSSSFNPAAF